MTERPGRADAISVVILAVGWVTMAILVDPTANIPLDDDWIYAGSVKSLLERGYFWFPGPAIPNLIVQAYWGVLFCLPFGFSFVALRASALVLGLAGVLALYAMLRRLDAAPRLALLGAVTLAVNPVWLNLATGFMTDVPFLSVTILALACLVTGIRRDSRVATIAGLVLALIAVLIRQTGLFLLIGYAIACPISHGYRPANLVKAGLPLLLGVALHVAIQHWVTTTGRAPDQVLAGVHALIPTSVGAFVVPAVRASIVAVPYLGAFIFPFVVLTGRATPSAIPSRWRFFRPIALVCITALVLGWVLWKDDGMPVLGNLMYGAGVGPLTLRDTLRLHINEPAVTPVMASLWLAANVIGVAGAVLLADRLLWAGIDAWSRRGRAASLFTLAVVTAAAYWGGILLLSYWDHEFFDRYILVLLPFAMLAVLATRANRLADDFRLPRMVLAVVCALLYAAFGVAGTHDYIAWNLARWRALDDLMATAHVTPRQIDGGYEFNGWMYHDPRFARDFEKDYWSGDPRQPYVITFGPIEGYHEIGHYPVVARWLPSTYAVILVLHKNDNTP